MEAPMHPATQNIIPIIPSPTNDLSVHFAVNPALAAALSSILSSLTEHNPAITKTVSGFPGLDRDADQAASDAAVLAAAQNILEVCREALTELSRRAYGANRNSGAVDAVDDAVNSLDEIATAVSMAGTAADGRENDALIALERRS